MTHPSDIAAGPGGTGIVVIGRDLGPRLLRCLDSVRGLGCPVVYVDSASSDASPARARETGVQVVELDPSLPLSASRGRNEGVRVLRGTHPELQFVQFVDGDCELDPAWLGHAVAAMKADANVGVVCGHLREKHADRSAVARVLDIDWSGPVGAIEACGGIFLCRLSAFAQAGEFAPGIVTGEEADLCARVRRAGFGVVRLDVPMGTHDAEMHRLGQWWQRTARVGRTYAQAAGRAGDGDSRAAARRVRSALMWGIAAPGIMLACLFAGFWWRPLWLVLAAAVALHAVFLARVGLRMRRRGLAPRDAVCYAFFTLLAKYAHATGCARFWARA